MDVIRFVVSHDDFGVDSLPSIEPEVNGVALRELAAPVEEPFARAEGNPDIAGGYAGLQEDDLLWPARHYLGEPQLSWFDDGDTVLLGCTCGEWGCWPLVTTVELTETTVRWSGFRTGHRDWDLSALGPFEFDRDAYEAALGRP